MAGTDETLKRDSNNQPVIGLVTDDTNQNIRMGRIDNTTKGLKVMIVGGSGAPVTGSGAVGEVAFWASPTALTGNVNFYYNNTSNQLELGPLTTGFDGNPQISLAISNNINNFTGIYSQNRSTGDTASTDFIAGNNIDGTAIQGHYVDVGIQGSGWVASGIGAIKTVSVNTAGSGYTVGDILTIVGGNNDGTVTVVTRTGTGVLTVSVTTNGTNYVAATGLSTTGGTGTGAKINILNLVDETVFTSNDGYFYASGGNAVYGTDNPGSAIKWTVGGLSAVNELMRLTSIGLSVNTSQDFTGTNSINTYSQMDAYLPNSLITNTLVGFNTDNAFPGYTSSSSRGTGISPTILQTGDTVGGFSGWGYTGSSPTYQNLAGMMIFSTGVTTTNLGGELEWYTKADGGALVQNMTLTNAGFLGVGSALTNTNIGSLLTIDVENLGATTPTIAQGAMLQNLTAATATVIQNSPALSFRSFAWNTTVPASQDASWKIFSAPTISATTSAILTIQSAINGGGFSTRFQMTSAGTTTFTGTLTVSGASAISAVNRTGIAVTSSDGFFSTNTTAATSGVTAQWSPRLRFSGTAWNTSTLASQTNDFIIENQTATGNPTTESLVISSQINGAGYFQIASLSNVGIFTLNAVSARLNIGTVVGVGKITTGSDAFSTSTTYSTSGFGLQIAPATYTSTTSSGTIATTGTNTFGIPTLAASSATTLTNASTVYIDGAPTQGTNVTITSGFPLLVNAGVSVFVGGIATSIAGPTVSNLGVSPGTTAGGTSSTQNLFAGGAGTNYRAIFNGTTTTTLAPNNNYTNVMVSSAPITTSATGTNAWLANLVVNTIGSITNGGGGFSTNTATLYVSAASTSGTSSNYGIYSEGNIRTPSLLTPANAITAVANAATVPVTFSKSIVTNNSAATLAITLTTTGAINMQTVIVQILDFSNVAQTLTWTNTENSTVSVPVLSNGSTSLPLTVGFMFNLQTSKWRCIASA